MRTRCLPVVVLLLTVRWPSARVATQEAPAPGKTAAVNGMEMYRSIPKSSLWIIPNGGHGPIHDRNVPFLAVAQEFLGG